MHLKIFKKKEKLRSKKNRVTISSQQVIPSLWLLFQILWNKIISNKLSAIIKLLSTITENDLSGT